LALGAAPIAGGALLGTLAGTIKGPDFRALIKSDMELLDKIPEQSVELRAALQRSIDERLYELITNVDRNRELRTAASAYKGNWRDIVVFVCALLFTLVWWNVPHSRTNWLITFIVLVILSVIIGVYAARGMIHVVRRTFSRA
jgi:ABC-type antimicrobial peptide transport system permease subunit